VALVIDRSGSMSGERPAQAKAAAHMAVSRLTIATSPPKAFDDTADVVMQAQPVNSALFINAIQQIFARGRRPSMPAY
jgi:uncharacterized protein with von Willebrand factor type A (vWA) domain